ncbi:MAG: ABC transporter permease [Candidatus Omnitrophica bacterium]|jgi:ABC-2 type transport system permease protein|nr:ABC transporter permease [Candidatus Omnitrophota bacterium]MDD5080136.1 ABC transporter permease [Candidatus Omnitrophota bacterium]
MADQRLKKIYTCRRILWDLALKQLKSRYSGARLGLWWAFITPLILALCINFVFISVFKIKMENYTVFVLAGILAWFFSVNTLSESAESFLVNAQVLKQNLFPREFIPVSLVLTNLLNFIIGLALLLPVFILLKPSVAGVLALLIPGIILHALFLAGMALILATVNVFFRDLSHFLGIAFMAWFWVTPVFYSGRMLPEELKWISALNPMAYYIAWYQNILFEAAVPGTLTIAVSCGISLFVFFAGYRFFLKNEHNLLKKI